MLLRAERLRNVSSPSAYEERPLTVDRIRRHLVASKMPSALEGLDGPVHGFEAGEISPLEPIEVLLSEERSLREHRRVKTALLTPATLKVKYSN